MVTKTEVARMRATVSRVTAAHSKGSVFPAEFRDEVMAYARERRTEGVRLSTISTEIGMSYWTLWGWCRAEASRRRAKKDVPATIVPVHVIAARPAPGRNAALTIYGPCGLRIEGADVETIAALVRSLA